MKISNLKVGTRLAAGFGLVLSLMIVLIGIAIIGFSDIKVSAQRLLDEDWLKAEKTSAIESLMRANAQRSMELVLLTDINQLNHSFEKVTENKNAIASALEILDKLVKRPEGKAMLADFKEKRGVYVSSLDKVVKLAREGQRNEATQIIVSETMPALEKARESIHQLSIFQKKNGDESGKKIEEDIAFSENMMVGLGLGAVLLGVFFAYTIARSITRPLHEAVQVARAVADGDLTCRVEVKSTDETGQLMQALKEMSESLVRIVGGVRTGVDEIATASNQIASGNLDLSSRTEEQASSLEETAASMEELTSTVRQNADNAKQASEFAIAASQVAYKGGDVVSQVVTTMDTINSSSKKIVEIISVIDGIAFQTNILALNAAVEAARAGEQGRGFAVVASEVRNLAQRSASAAKEIKVLIDDSVNKVDAGSILVGEAGETMQEIVQGIKRVTDIMQEITGASNEQASGIEQVNQAVAQMDQVTQQNAALVEEAAAAAQSLQHQAATLLQTVSVFKIDAPHLASSGRMSKSLPKREAVVRHSKPTLKIASRGVANKKTTVTNDLDGDWETF